VHEPGSACPSGGRATSREPSAALHRGIRAARLRPAWALVLAAGCATEPKTSSTAPTARTPSPALPVSADASPAGTHARSVAENPGLSALLHVAAPVCKLSDSYTAYGGTVQHHFDVHAPAMPADALRAAFRAAAARRDLPVREDPSRGVSMVVLSATEEVAMATDSFVSVVVPANEAWKETFGAIPTVRRSDSWRLIQALPAPSKWTRVGLETASNGFWYLLWEIDDVSDPAAALSAWGTSLALAHRDGEWIREIDPSRPGTSGLLAQPSARGGIIVSESGTVPLPRGSCTPSEPVANEAAAPPASSEQTARRKREDDALLEEMMRGPAPASSPSAVPPAEKK
jgi:hypothetical protein